MFFADLSSDGRLFHNLGPRFERQFCPMAMAWGTVPPWLLFIGNYALHTGFLVQVRFKRFCGRKDTLYMD